MKKGKDESAVSPVVGVMLMLVVTIIIAATVSAYSGGLAKSQQKAPTAVLDVRIHALENVGGSMGYGSGWYTPTMTIREVSGDVLPTKDLKIITYFSNSSGIIYAGNLSGEKYVTGDPAWTYFDGGDAGGVLVFNDMNRFGGYITTNSTQGLQSWFGNASAILRPGDVLTTVAGSCGNYDESVGPTTPRKNPSINYLVFNNEDLSGSDYAGYGFVQGASVNVKVIHIPSGKAIFDKDVMIE